MQDLLNPEELKPKDILRFVETREDRALEVLSEIVAMPESQYDEPAIMNMARQALSDTNTAWTANVTTPMIGMQNIQGGLNGR